MSRHILFAGAHFQHSFASAIKIFKRHALELDPWVGAGGGG